MLKKIASWIVITILLLNLINVILQTTSFARADPKATMEIAEDSCAPNGYSALSTAPPMEWNKTYGTEYLEYASSVVQTSDGGYAIAGYVKYMDTWVNFLLVKTDADGNVQWNKTYGGGGIYVDEQDYAFSVIQTYDGGYAIAGVKYTYAEGGDFWLVKTDACGDMMWNKTYDGAEDDWAYSVIQTGDGGYVIAGYSTSLGGWLIKTDAFGNLEWNKTYDGALYSLIQTSDGGYALAGYHDGYWGDAWLVKTDAHGNMMWSKTYGGTYDEAVVSVVQTSDGGYAIAGYTASFGAGYADFWLVKTDVFGNLEWNKTYGGPYSDYATSIVQAVDGGYVIGGSTTSFGAGGYDLWLVKTDTSGNILWSQTYGGAHNDQAFSLVETMDGGYAIAGYTESFGAGESDFWLIKLAPTHLTATLHINPKGLNLWSRGKWITAYIELPEGYDVSDTNISSILLNQAITVDQNAPTEIGDYDSDGIPDLMIKFDRAEVIGHILAVTDLPPRFKTVKLTITGQLNDETPFQGNCTIRTIYMSPRVSRTSIFPI